MVIFVNFASIASISVCFHLGTLHGYFLHQDFWPNLNFPLEYQIKLVLMSKEIFRLKIDLLDGSGNTSSTINDAWLDDQW